MKINHDTPPHTNAALYTAFSSIPLDIEGSNLDKTGWIPSEDDKKIMGEQNYNLAVADGNAKNANVMFKNVFLQWDSCDCGDGYGCSHGSYVFEIEIQNTDKTYTIEYEDGDSLVFEGFANSVKIPVAGATIFDFCRACELCEIELELSDYAVSLLNN